MSKYFSLKPGFTLIEMLVTLTILAILASATLPLAKIAVKRQEEIELRRCLRQIRTAIDEYKKLADQGKIKVEENTYGYPPDLETLVKGVEIKTEEETKLVKFLRRIPKDPMTDSYDWGLRSYQDEPDSNVWGGENVYDIYTKSSEKALDGTPYRNW